MLALLASSLLFAQGALPALTVRGPDLVDPAGKRVLLKGCNLGNWLIVEGWMIPGMTGFKDQYDLEETLSSRFGREEDERLMDVYRSNWITPRDLKIVKTFGMNVVRLPINYRLVEDDTNPYHLRKDAWEWLDKAVDMAEAEGIYTILDMHGVQGGQTENDHTGRSGQNKLWSEAENPKRLAWLWSEVAKRYRDRSAVVAYDLFNEPYGGTKPDQVRVFKQVYAATRKSDPEKLIYAMGNYDDFTHYGSPASNGWHNVGYQMHYYPGLFGGGSPTVQNYARHLSNLPLVAETLKSYNAPFLVGEMNVVFNSAGGAAMMRRAYDVDAHYGWATTMWSYKVLGKEGGIGDASWGMVTNAAPEPLIDVKTASKADIETYFKNLSTEKYEVFTELQQMLSAANPVLPPLPEIEKPLIAAPAKDTIPGWTSTDVGGALTGGLKVGEAGFSLYGSGSDIWGKKDEFRFLHKTVTGDFELGVTLDGLKDTDSYAKAGLMVRTSLEPDAKAVLVTSFPSGEIQLAVRAANGLDMAGLKSANVKFPVRLRLKRTGNQIAAMYATESGEWQPLGDATFESPNAFVGAIALSHDNRQLTKVDYRNLRLAQ